MFNSKYRWKNIAFLKLNLQKGINQPTLVHMGGRIIRSFCLLQRGWIARANKVERNGAIILIGGPVVIMNQPRIVEMVHILYVMHTSRI